MNLMKHIQKTYHLESAECAIFAIKQLPQQAESGNGKIALLKL